MEAAVVIGSGGRAIYWHLPEDRTSGSLPDGPGYPPSVRLWDFILENMDEVEGIAHSHPGGGVPGPSGTDLGTFVAVEKALGRLDWWITSSEATVLIRWRGPGRADYAAVRLDEEPPWVAELRAASGYGGPGARGVKLQT